MDNRSSHKQDDKELNPRQKRWFFIVLGVVCLLVVVLTVVLSNGRPT